MVRVVEAVVEHGGKVRLLEPVQLSRPTRAFVLILDEEPEEAIPETLLLSEAALAVDWERPEEDEAWIHLQQEQSS
ncbi:MAG: hypothetical protein GXO55_03850 [Chloroflexi bacterium]|nr:hypothetical protein [Chloroflexota bacterium]